MTSINDFGSTYMCQSLPFGGVKDSGFDRFAGVEGLRGLCVPKAVCQDRSADHFVSKQLALSSLFVLHKLSAVVQQSRTESVNVTQCAFERTQ